MHLMVPLLGRQVEPSPVSSISTNSASIISTSRRTASATSARASRTTSSRAYVAASATVSATASATASLAEKPPSKDEGESKRTTYVVATIAIVATFLAVFFLFLALRRTRRLHKNPKYIPTPFLKRIWRNWEPAPPHLKLPRNNEHFEPISTTVSRRLGPSGAEQAQQTETSGTTGDIGTARVDRNTSVRSVMTLPAYRPNAHQNEQVLGREGERGGIDVVLEFPETQDQEERLREEEMEALYQVRLARRRENEERDERRRLRREARERGDHVALRELQARARASSTAAAGRSVEELRAEHDRLKNERNRTVSSVSYADLGVARHDGTRIRANSEESERTGLLGDAASFAASSQYHRRDRSASSVISIDTMNSDLPSPSYSRARANSRPDNMLRRASTQEGMEGRAGSSPELIDHEDAPSHDPPGYENISLDTPSRTPAPIDPPPTYTSPTLAQGESHSNIESQIASSQTTTRGRSNSTTHISTQISSSSSSSPHQTSQTQQPPTSSSPHNRLTNPRPEIESRTQSRSPGRGVGGAPQLPSLKLANLPKIQVDPGSPVVRMVGEGQGL